MDFIEKAKMRLEHWIHHNEHHNEEYELFADQLDEAGRKESASFMREMMELSLKSTECLRNALKAIEP